jgi:hypothetical protein
MSRTKKIIISVAASVIVLMGAGVTYVSITDQINKTPSTEVAVPITTPEPTPENDPTDPGPGDTYVTLGMLSTSDNKIADNVLESALKPEVEVYEEGVIGLMHHMTHQKVKASDKWKSIQMTPTRVRLVREIIEQKGKEWKNRDELLKIAKKWEAGDFSKIDEDHNFFWNLEDGSIGKATGILSPIEEEKFVSDTFDSPSR